MVINIIFLSLSLISGLSFIILLLTAGRFDDYITPLDEEEFSIPYIYGVGFKIIDIFKFEFKSKEATQIREDMIILYGQKYAEYYLRVAYAQKISIIYLIFALMCALSSLANGTDKLLILGIGIVLCGVIYYILTVSSGSKIKKRSAVFLNEFPNAVSTIALLVNSGMLLREAWREVSISNDTELYMQMRKVNEDINNGIPEIDALYAFADRCVTPEIKKFTSFIVQGLEKGSKDLTFALKNQTSEMWEMKKQNTLRLGELASSKLMIPLMSMFIGILVMIIGPIMTNLGF